MIVFFALVALFLILHLNLPREAQRTVAPAEIEYAYTGRLPRRFRRREPRPLPPFLVRLDGLQLAA